MPSTIFNLYEWKGFFVIIISHDGNEDGIIEEKDKKKEDLPG